MLLVVILENYYIKDKKQKIQEILTFLIQLCVQYTNSAGLMSFFPNVKVHRNIYFSFQFLISELFPFM
jgi:hypothetical protein